MFFKFERPGARGEVRIDPTHILMVRCDSTREVDIHVTGLVYRVIGTLDHDAFSRLEPFKTPADEFLVNPNAVVAIKPLDTGDCEIQLTSGLSYAVHGSADESEGRLARVS